MILLQAHLYNYNLLKGVTFDILALSSYTLSPQLETFLELLSGKASSANITFF